MPHPDKSVRSAAIGDPPSGAAISPAAAAPLGTSPPPEFKAQAILGDPMPSGSSFDLAAVTQHSSIKPKMTFQERIAIERQRKDQEPSRLHP